MNWFVKVMKNYAVFTGRAQRAEYWYFVLICFVIAVVLNFVDSMTGTYNSEAGVGLLGGVFSLAIILPALAVSARRLHDTGRSGWWLLLLLLPILGTLILLIFFVLDSQPGANQYGPNPKGVEIATGVGG